MADGEQVTELVNAQYGRVDVAAAILAALREIGKDDQTVTPRDLATLDHFHGGGYPATLELAHMADLRAGQRVLDIGGGIGGPARTLASEFGCSVTVLDLTEEFCRTGQVLTAWTGLDDRVSFHHGDACALPFDDASFDVVWTEFSQMNIADKEAVYAGVARVLRPGGRLAFQEIMAGPVQPVHLPVHWADRENINFLRPPADIRELLHRLGFVEVAWVDTTAAFVALQRSAATDAAVRTLPHLSFLLRPREEAERVGQTVAQNVQEGRIVFFRGVFDKP